MNNIVTVIIPARKEPYVNQTVADLLDNATDEVEIILVLDGWEPDYKIKRRNGLKILRHATPEGMRPSINQAAEVATGDYIMKIDSHCSIGPGWDAILKADCADNWIVIPRRYWWDAPNWDYKTDNSGNVKFVDYMTYLYPFIKPYRPRLTCRPDYDRTEKNLDNEITEDMGFQGSCWFMHKAHFLGRLGGMDHKSYGTFGEEPQEIGLKTQLGPWHGAVMRNKKTWYAHWGKPQSHWRTDPDVAGRITDQEREASYLYTWDYWWHNKWEDRAHDFEWLVEKFWPLRTWPDNWKWLSTQYTRYKLSELWHTLRQP